MLLYVYCSVILHPMIWWVYPVIWCCKWSPLRNLLLLMYSLLCITAFRIAVLLVFYPSFWNLVLLLVLARPSHLPSLWKSLIPTDCNTFVLVFCWFPRILLLIYCICLIGVSCVCIMLSLWLELWIWIWPMLLLLLFLAFNIAPLL